LTTTSSPSSNALSGSKASKSENPAGDFWREDDLDRAPEPLDETEDDAVMIFLPDGALSFTISHPNTPPAITSKPTKTDTTFTTSPNP
jgi:hypothetical protein